MAFVVIAPIHQQISSNVAKLSRRRPLTHAMRVTMTDSSSSAKTTSAEPASNAQSSITDVYGSGAYPSVDFDPDVMKDKMKAVVQDVGARPGYYGKIVGYAVGALVAVTILNAVVAAVDSIPVLPSALELIGLGYTSWFVWRYVLFKESREELLEEIEDLMGKAKPPSSS